MALILQDRVQENATANTTVSFSLSGAVTGYQSFAAVGNGNTTYYGATDGTNWEVGVGTYTLSTTTLTRNTILSSSNSGSAVSTFGSNLIVWVDYPSEKSVNVDGSGNVTGYAISSGTINNTVIGATTPNTGTFTTITGQTEVLKGTGMNLIKQSQTIGTSPWNQTGTATAATNSSGTTDPLGGNTASLITSATDTGFAGNAINQLLQTSTSQQVVSGVTYTFSVYIKAGTATTMQIALRDNSTGSLPTYTLTPTSSWQRISVSLTLGSSTTSIYAILGGANGTFYAWGAQVEYGSTANTYVPTTTTAIYGTPTLSFSGVAGLGLQSDGSLYVSPAGTGALQAQATTSSTVGGNARGANSVDFQTSRTSASQVASGTTGFIGSGRNNTVSGQDNFIGAGYQNYVVGGAQSAIVSGANNTVAAAASPSFIGGGNSNITGISYASIVGGQSNSANGYYSFIGGGQTNAVLTSTSSVTTQAAATNGVTSGSTAVTLAASNASIKVGQLLTGTGIAFPTYVAAISGTSLTLSQNANATGTPTLSFYTPHGVVVGGGNNQATGSYSFIGGGGDAGTATNRNVASGDWSVVCGGSKNVASGLQSAVLSGSNNTASGVGSVVCGGGTYDLYSYSSNIASGQAAFVGAGWGNNCSGFGSAIVGGANNVSSGLYTSVVGGSYGTTRGLLGYIAFPAGNFSATIGGAQSGLLILNSITTNATATVLTSNGSAAGTTNQVILPNNSAYYFKGSLIANITGAADGAAWSFEGAIMRGANAAATVLIGTPMLNRVAVANGSGGSSSWVIALTADTTNGGLAVTVTGTVGSTIRWVAKIETTEVTF